MKAIGIDFGSKRIGIAISYHGKNAMPYSVIPAEPLSQAISLIEEIVEENQIDTVVVGIPYSLSGAESQQTVKTLEFEKILSTRLNKNIVKIDERLTTKQIESFLLRYGIKKRKDKKDIDKYSAALILQQYLEASKENN